MQALALLAFVLVSVAGAELYVRYRDKVEDMRVLHSEVALSASFKVRRFVTDIERTMRQATYHRESILNGVSSSMRFQLLGLLKAEPGITTVAALDTDGRERAKVSRAQLVLPSDLADRSSSVAFQRTKDGGSYYGKPYFSRGSEPHMILAVPISWFDGEASGVLVAEIALLNVSELISQTVVGSGGYIYVVSNQGDLIAHPDASLVLQRRNVSDLDQLDLTDAALSRSERTYTSLEGKQVFAAAARVEDLGWTVVVEQDSGEVLAPLWWSFARTCAFALATLTVAAYLSLLIRRRVVRPLDALQSGATKLGEGDFAHRIIVRSGDEFERVAEAFNRMSERLGLLYHALEQQADRRKIELTIALLEAADLAKRSGDGERLAVSALGYQSSIGDQPDDARVAVGLLEEALNANPSAGPALLVALDTALCRAYVLADKPHDAMETYQRAVAAARGLKNEMLLFQAHRAIAGAHWPSLLAVRMEAGRVAMTLADKMPRRPTETGTLAFSLFKSLVEFGDLAEANLLAAKMANEAAAGGDPDRVTQRVELMLAMQLSATSEVEGRIDAARGPLEANSLFPLDLPLVQLFALRRCQGRIGELREAVEERCRNPRSAQAWEPLLVLLYLDIGERDEARRVLDRCTARGYFTHPSSWLVTIAHLAEGAARLADKSQAKALREMLLPYAAQNVVSDAVCLGAVERYLGLLDESLGDIASALRRFRAATAFHLAEFQPVWLAHSRVDLARALINSGRADRWRLASPLVDEAAAAAAKIGLRRLGDECQQLLATRPVAVADLTPLTPSESRVLRLLATGATNRAIGEQLKLSRHTVANHVRNILGKTNTANRTEASNFARDHDLIAGEETDE